MLHAGQLTHYFQMILWLEKSSRFVFVIIPEDDQRLLLYSQNLSSLIQFTQLHINRVQEGQRRFSLPPTRQSRLEMNNCFEKRNWLLIRRQVEALVDRLGLDRPLSLEEFEISPPLESEVMLALEAALQLRLEHLCHTFGLEKLSMAELVFGTLAPKTQLIWQIGLQAPQTKHF